MRPNSRGKKILHAQVMQLQTDITGTINGSVHLWSQKSEMGNRDVLRLIFQMHEVSAQIHLGNLGFRVRQGLDRRFPRGDMREDGLIHARTTQGHAGFRPQRCRQFIPARRQFYSIPRLTVLYSSHQILNIGNLCSRNPPGPQADQQNKAAH